MSSVVPRSMRIPFALIGIVIAFHAIAQDTASSRLSDAYLLTGHLAEQNIGMPFDEWRSIFPESKILNVDPSAFNDEDIHRGSYGPYFFPDRERLFHVGASIHLGAPSTRKGSLLHKLRSGATYFGRSHIARSRSVSERAAYDTLTSSVTGDQFVIDTAHTLTYSASAGYSRIGIDLLYLIERPTPGNWNFQFGAGITAGALLGEKGYVTLTESRTLAGLPYESSYPDTVEYGRRIAEESFDVENEFLFGVQALLGVSYRLSKAHAFWSAVMIHGEVRPALLIGGQLGSDRTVPGIQRSIGLRFDLDR